MCGSQVFCVFAMRRIPLGLAADDAELRRLASSLSQKLWSRREELSVVSAELKELRRVVTMAMARCQMLQKVG